MEIKFQICTSSYSNTILSPWSTVSNLCTLLTYYNLTRLSPYPYFTVGEKNIGTICPV